METKLINQAQENIDGYRSFTGKDITAYAYFPFLDSPIKLGALSFISVSTQRSKSMVTSLGRAGGRGFTRGARVISGVISFIQLDRSPFSPLYDTHLRNTFTNYGLSAYADELPPFHLLLTYVNEEQEASYRLFESIEIVQEQFSDSIDELSPQNTFSFVCLGMTPLTPLSKIRKKVDNEKRFSRALIGKSIKTVNGKLVNNIQEPSSVEVSLNSYLPTTALPNNLLDFGFLDTENLITQTGLLPSVPTSIFNVGTASSRLNSGIREPNQ